MSPDPPVDSSILTSRASQEEMWMFSEKPPRLPSMCRRTRAHLCLVYDITTGESLGQDHLCLAADPKASVQTLG